VEVTASDGTNSSSKLITVALNDVNDTAPVITTAASQSVAEGQTFVAALTATDADAVGGPAAFSISGGADAARFTITAGVLHFQRAPNYENATDADADNVYEITVQATDGANPVTRAITVHVTDINDAPVITSNGGGGAATIHVDENTIAVTTVTASD